MKARRFDEVLRARGYKMICSTPEHSDYKKIHKYWVVHCRVWKDSHKKGKTMHFEITDNAIVKEGDINEFKEAEFDRSYLVKEVTKIHEAFEQLKQLKSPKHIYCF